MMRPQIIGLSGPKGCGKDTVANYLRVHAGFSHHAFANALRTEICNAFLVPDNLFSTHELKDTPTPELALERNVALDFGYVVMNHLRKLHGDHALAEQLAAPRTPREIMKWWANEYRREISGNDYWTSIIRKKVYQEQAHHQWKQVISDVRFPHEAKAVRSMGGVIWQVTRPGLVPDPSDVTETSGSEFAPKAKICNNGDTRQLQLLVLAAWVQADCHASAQDIVDMGQAVAAGMAA